MNSTEDKCKSLQQRLNQLPEPAPDATQKIKLSSLQELMNKLHQSYEEESIANEFKMKEMVNLVKKLEAAAKEQCESLQVKEEMDRMKIARAQKNAHKAVEKISKQRKQTEKKVNSSLESCLIELTSAKTRSLSTCKFAIKEFNSLESAINGLQTAIQNEQISTQEISKKIFAQYSSQMQELADIMSEQKKQKQMEEARIVDKLQKMYLKMHNLIANSRKQREHNEEELINFLEKVIEKVRREMMRQ